MLSDSVVIAIAGGVAGTLLAVWTSSGLPALLLKRDTASLVFHLTHRTLPGVLRFTRTVFFADTLKCVSRCLPTRSGSGAVQYERMDAYRYLYLTPPCPSRAFPPEQSMAPSGPVNPSRLCGNDRSRREPRSRF